MNRTIIGVCAPFALVSVANAAMVFDFSYSGAGVMASGTFITPDTLNSYGAYTVTAITGQRNGAAITGLTPSQEPSGQFQLWFDGPPGPSTFVFAFDDFLYASSPQVDFGGILFNSASSRFPFELWFNGTELLDSAYLGSVSGHHVFVDTPITLEVTAVPEPSTMLLGIGLLALALPNLRSGNRSNRP